MMTDHDEKESLFSELSERLSNGIFKENPTFVLLLGMCPTLAVTTSAKNGLGMGITTLVVLALSNLFISLLRKIIPDKIRIPAFIVIIASFVTIVELLLNAYIPSLYKALGLYIPLIVVNCIILGRAEAYAYSHRPLPSLFDGIGMGMGFTIALTIIGSLRELLGAGTIFGAHVMPKGFVPVSIFIMAPGAFFVLALLTAIQNKVKEIGEKKGKDMSKIQSGCGGNCLSCDKDCKVNMAEPSSIIEKVEDESKEAATVSINTLLKENETVKKPLEEKPSNEASVKSKSLKERLFKDKKVKEEPKEDKPVKEKQEKAKKEEKAVEEKPIKEEKPVKVEKPKKAEPKKVEPKKEEPKKAEPVKEETVSKEMSSQEDSDIELLDFSDLKKAISKPDAPVKKPVRKRASLEKAQAMLNKAEEELKEEKND